MFLFLLVRVMCGCLTLPRTGVVRKGTQSTRLERLHAVIRSARETRGGYINERSIQMSVSKNEWFRLVTNCRAFKAAAGVETETLLMRGSWGWGWGASGRPPLTPLTEKQNTPHCCVQCARSVLIGFRSFSIAKIYTTNRTSPQCRCI